MGPFGQREHLRDLEVRPRSSSTWSFPRRARGVMLTLAGFSCLEVSLARFLANVAGLLPLPAVFLAGFLAHVTGLLLPHLAGLLETSAVFLPLLVRLFSLLTVIHRSPPDVLHHHDNPRSRRPLHR